MDVCFDVDRIRFLQDFCVWSVGCPMDLHTYIHAYIHTYIHTGCAMLSSGIPWNMPRLTCIFCIRTSLQASLYTKKIQEIMPKSSKTYGNFWKSSELPKTSEMLRNRF